MKLHISKQVIVNAVKSFLTALMIGVGISLFIHKLGSIIRSIGAFVGLGKDTETYEAIFDQLQEAEVHLPSILLLVLCILLITGAAKYFSILHKKSTGKKGLRIIGNIVGVIGILLAILLVFFIALWFTDVNGIRFGTVVKFLYNALQHGVF